MRPHDDGTIGWWDVLVLVMTFGPGTVFLSAALYW